VFDAVGFPKYPIVPSSNVLTVAQRALAELVALRRDVPIVNGSAMPEQRWVLRRWLGIDPPGALEREVEYEREGARVRGPLWCALVADSANAVIAERLPLIDRIELFGDDAVWAYFIRKSYGEAPIIAKPDLHALRDEGRAWAPRYADELVHEPRVRNWAPLDLVFVALARAQVPIEPRWDVLLPIALAETDRELSTPATMATSIAWAPRPRSRPSQGGAEARSEAVMASLEQGLADYNAGRKRHA
jgi:hypothetical protein